MAWSWKEDGRAIGFEYSVCGGLAWRGVAWQGVAGRGLAVSISIREEPVRGQRALIGSRRPGPGPGPGPRVGRSHRCGAGVYSPLLSFAGVDVYPVASTAASFERPFCGVRAFLTLLLLMTLDGCRRR